jgi:hypothetical protein
MRRVATLIVALTPCLAAAGESDGGVSEASPEAAGLELYASGDLERAIDEEEACGREGATRCRVLAEEMREVRDFAKRAPALSQDDAEKFFALDRLLSPGLWSRIRVETGARIAEAFSAKAVQSLQSDNLPRACSDVAFAFEACPDCAASKSALRAVREREFDGLQQYWNRPAETRVTLPSRTREWTEARRASYVNDPEPKFGCGSSNSVSQHPWPYRTPYLNHDPPENSGTDCTDRLRCP